jgi:hydroxyethylthiazole kinase-like uncharacterized protein yjeF
LPVEGPNGDVGPADTGPTGDPIRPAAKPKVGWEQASAPTDGGTIMQLATAAQMREIDRRAIQERGIPGLALMENAGIAVLRVVRERLDESGGRRVAIVCGKGNNGGDGLVVARHLRQLGAEARVVLLARGADLGGDAAANWRAARDVGVPIREAAEGDVRAAVLEAVRDAAVVVDAILGTGVTGEVRGPAREAIEAINETGARRVVAVDIPSGADSDTGRVLGACVRADHTVTLGLPKVGLYVYPAAKFCGRVVVDDIGIPQDLLAIETGVELIEPARVAAILPTLPPDAHKGDAGRLVVVAGSVGMTGAAALCCEAAMRMGAGLVYLCCPESLNDILEVKLTEPITRPMPETDARTLSLAAAEPILALANTADALVLGPGLSTHPETARCVQRLVREARAPCLVDADGLNCLADTPDLLAKMPAPKVISPHPGELARLTGATTAEIQDARLVAARAASERFGAVVVLKGAGTIVAEPSGRVAVNPTGNPGMASGGTGDVLAGMIGTLLAQRVDPFDAAVAAVYLHGLAGDLSATRTGTRCVVATDLIEMLSSALSRATAPENS